MHLLNFLGGVSFGCKVGFDRLDMPVVRTVAQKSTNGMPHNHRTSRSANHRDRHLGGTILLGRIASVIPRRQSCAYPACITRIAIRPHRTPGSNDPGLERPVACEHQIAAAQWRRRAKEKATYTCSRQSKYLAHSHII